MGMKGPLVTEIAVNTYAINEYGLVTMYLLAGSSRALLIDTGCGFCDLNAVVRKMTDLPYSVVLTHGHLDHAGGMVQFPEIFLNRRDLLMAESITSSELSDYANTLGEMGSFDAYDFSADALHRRERKPVFHFIEEGWRIDLGGRVIEAYAVPGHTPGSMAFLDRKNRILFSGDCCNTNLLADHASVTTIYRSIMKVVGLMPAFDRNFNGHTGYAGSPDCLSQPYDVPKDLLWICQAILRHEVQPTKPTFLKNMVLYQVRHGTATLSYNPDRLTDPGEKPVDPEKLGPEIRCR